MFYLILSILFVALLGTFLVLNYTKFKNSQKFKNVVSTILKVASVVYCVLMILNILLPDAFTIENAVKYDVFYSLIRWFSVVSFATLPVAVFFKNRTVRNIAIYFTTIVTIAQIFLYPMYLNDFTSTMGKGLNSISVISSNVKTFLINGTFRSFVFGFFVLMQLLIPVVLAFNEKHCFNFKDKKEYLYFFLALPAIVVSMVPIYAPQHLFGLTDVIFSAFSLPHILWIVSIIVEIVALYLIFKNKDKDIKMVVLFIMALSLLLQYNQMFGAISINIKRLPLQLCNVGSLLVLLSLITKNQKIFNFTLIINVVGVLFALAVPDLDDKGFFYLYNMHFIFEHTNVLVVPILASLFGIFKRLDKYALRDCLIGFAIYFVSVLALGTMFNAIATSTGNTFWSANYLFMFDKNAAVDLIPFLGSLFDIKFNIGVATFYPAIQSVVFVVFSLICVLLYFVIRLVYLIKDKLTKHKKA